MLTVSEAFEKFRQRLELSKSEADDAIKRHKQVREAIGKEFSIKRDFLTGSYGRHTKTKPLKDVDIFFVLGTSEDHRRKESASSMLKAFDDCLMRAFGRDAVQTGRRAVTVEFDKQNPSVDEDGKVLSIDAIAAFDASEHHYEIPDGTLNQWIKTDPEIHAEKATAKNSQLNGKWIPFVKMMKSWNRAASKPIKPSFLIEVMALDLVAPPFGSYSHEALQFFSAARSAIDRDWPDPAGLGPPVSDQMDANLKSEAKRVLREAELKAEKAFRAEEQGRIGDALELWAEIFGRYFPKS